MRSFAILVAAMSLASAAAAKNPPTTRDAYDLAMRCTVANVHLSETFKKAGDSANAQLFDQRAKRAFDASKGYASILKIEWAQFDRDFDAVQDRELRRLLSDRSYLSVIAAECKAASLM